MSYENQKKWKELLLRAARIARGEPVSVNMTREEWLRSTGRTEQAELERVEAENRVLDAAGRMTAPHERQFCMASCNSLLLVLGRASVVAACLSEHGEIRHPTIIHTYN